MARGSEKTSAWMCIIRSPPAVYSMTKHTCSGVWKHANKLTRKGWWELLTVSKIRFSHMRLRRRTGGAWGEGAALCGCKREGYSTVTFLPHPSPRCRPSSGLWWRTGCPSFYTRTATPKQCRKSLLQTKHNLCVLIIFLSTTNEKCSNTGFFFILLGKPKNKYLPKVASAENCNHFEVLQGKRASAGSEREKHHKTIKTRTTLKPSLHYRW